jgi:hypothetical protein
MFESLFMSPVLHTGNQRLVTVFCTKLKAAKISYTVKLDDLNHRGPFNDTSTFSPHTAFLPAETVYVSHAKEEKALHLLSKAKEETAEEI